MDTMYNRKLQEKIFLIMVLNIYLNYQKYLNENNQIDFDNGLKHPVMIGINQLLT